MKKSLIQILLIVFPCTLLISMGVFRKPQDFPVENAKNCQIRKIDGLSGKLGIPRLESGNSKVKILQAEQERIWQSSDFTILTGGGKYKVLDSGSYSEIFSKIGELHNIGPNLFALKNGDYYDLLDKRGNIISQKKYSYIGGYGNTIFKDGYIPAMKYGKDGNLLSHYVLDSQGKEILELSGKEYTYIKAEGKNIIYRIDTKEKIFSGLLNKKGQRIPPHNLTTISFFRGGYAVYSMVQEDYGFKYGILDESGNIIVPAIYDDIGYHSQNCFNEFSLVEETKYFPAVKGELYGILDRNGGVALPFEYDSIYVMGDPHLTDTKMRAVLEYSKKSEKGYLDKNLKKVLSWNDSGDITIFGKTIKTNLRGIYSVKIQGDVLLIDISNTDKAGSAILGLDGSVKVPYKSDQGIYYIDKSYFLVSHLRKNIIYDSSLDQFISTDRNSSVMYISGKLLVYSNSAENQFGLMTANGKLLSEPIFSSITDHGIIERNKKVLVSLKSASGQENQGLIDFSNCLKN